MFEWYKQENEEKEEFEEREEYEDEDENGDWCDIEGMLVGTATDPRIYFLDNSVTTRLSIITVYGKIKLELWGELAIVAANNVVCQDTIAVVGTVVGEGKGKRLLVKELGIMR